MKGRFACLVGGGRFVIMADLMLIYDGECPLCLRARDWLAARVPADVFTFVPCQSETRAQQAPQVTYAQCMRAMQLVLPDGTVYAGAAALPHILRHVPRWRLLAGVFALPGVRSLTPPLYRVVARNRGALAGLLKHEPPGKRCSEKSSCRRSPPPRR
ncbi:MAG: thiol-disulfide oxidoreductase DCC family protein [Candidatus Hydrogenedentota bacterium]